MSEITSISKTTARRFILGRQGLWPGRRWTGKDGVAAAIRECEAVQMDPLIVVARSHDITLASRVLEYRPEYLDQVMYTERSFFDYGGGLHIYPMSELPYWSSAMRRIGERGRWANTMAEHPQAVELVRQELRSRGPLGNRDLDGSRRVDSYRGRKDTALALYALWITGEVMVHHRRRFERIYDLRENVAPPEFNYSADEADASEYFSRKVIANSGMVRQRPWAVSLGGYLNRAIDRDEGRELLNARVDAGKVSQLRVETSKDVWHVLSDDLPVLEALERGEVPAQWHPAGPTTLDEVTILAPLEIVSARGRSKWLFDFDYVWEVYKPANQRRWGYYTIPILYGDRLVARLDPRLDRTTGILKLEGFWLEDSLVPDDDFAAALGRGLLRFARFLEANRVNIAAIQPAGLREGARREIAPALEVET